MTARSMLRQIVPPFLWTLASRAKRGAIPSLPPPDEQIEWLRASIPGWLNAGNVRAFDFCIREMPDGAVVEIGVYAGLSTNVIGHFLAKHGRATPFFSADPWLVDNPIPPPLAADIDQARWTERRRGFIMQAYDRATRLNSAGRLPHHFELFSDAFFAAWGEGATRTDFFGRETRLGGPIAFAYIDGDHSAEQVWKDFSNIDRHLAEGGFVLFDDSGYARFDGAALSAARAAARPDYRLVSKAPHYCIQKTG